MNFYDRTEQKIAVFGRAFAEGFAKGSIALYVLPTVLRKSNNLSEEQIEDRNPIRDMGTYAGAMTGLFGFNAFQFSAYASLIRQGTPAWILPVATNLISAAWEVGRMRSRRGLEEIS